MDEFRQSQEFQNIFTSNGFTVIDVGQDQVGYVMKPKILPFVSTTIVPRVKHPEAVSLANDYGRKLRSIYVVLAPKVAEGSEEAGEWQRELDNFGFKPANFGLAPTKTLVLDLEPPDDDILAQMKSKTRYNVRLSYRREITSKVIRGDELEKHPEYMDEFYNVYIENCQRISRRCEHKLQLEQQFKGFGKNCYLIHSYDKDGQIAGVASYLVAGDTSCYQMNGSTEQGRKDFATNQTVWEGVLEAKRRGCKWLDFDGIYDERYPKAQEEWKGFSRFKSSFGGQEITFMGSHIKWFPFLKKNPD